MVFAPEPPDSVSYTKYRTEVDNLLASYKTFYDHHASPMCHTHMHTADLSYRITQYVRDNFKDSFRLQHHPIYERKVFNKYDPHDPLGN